MRFPISLALTLGLALPTAALATADKASRYPFDPVCPWGRLANGKGMIHRCISEGEARSLAAERRDSQDEGERGSPKVAPKDKTEKDAPPRQPLPRSVEVTVGPISAEQGELTIGRLDVPLDRYRQCVEENGGITAPSGKIIVKFLVRAERVRAEGASVDSYENVSKKAAECVAAVVDRRQVGTPSVPMTGAQLTFSLREKK